MVDPRPQGVESLIGSTSPEFALSLFIGRSVGRFGLKFGF